MIWKACGCVSLMIAGSLCGIWKAQQMDRRVQTLQAFGWMLKRIESEIRYTRTPTAEIFAGFLNDPTLSKLGFLPELAASLRRAEPFAEAWEKAICGAAPAMQWTKADCRMALSLGGILGAADAESQSEAIALLEEELAAQQQEAKKNSRTLGRMYRSLGVLAGIGMALLFV